MRGKKIISHKQNYMVYINSYVEIDLEHKTEWFLFCVYTVSTEMCPVAVAIAYV